MCQVLIIKLTLTAFVVEALQMRQLGRTLLKAMG